MRFKIFISSVQKEFKDERKALRDYIHGDALLRKFYEVFIFEDLPASDRRADEVYLDKVKSSDIYLGLFGSEYGVEDSGGISPTRKEFLLAAKLGKPRLIFIRGDNDSKRHHKMLDLIRLAGDQLIRRRFNTYSELQTAVYASLVNHLFVAGKIAEGPFDATVCRKAGISDISEDKIRWFLSRAQSARSYALAANTSVIDVLTHLDLLDHGRPNHAAILLFGIKPQRFLITSEVKCMHFHTLEKRKPIPSYQIYKGTLFDLVDQAVDFVMSKLNRSIGTRAKGPQAPVEYDIPEEVVAEGIVNAIAHRDYISNASVEVQLFPDRLEIWNPGTIHPPLTLEKLLLPHASQPNNPLIAEPLFLTKYIEKAGSGTVDMINRCISAGIRGPEFKIDGGFFVLTVWRKQAKGQPESRPESGPSRGQFGINSSTQSPTQSSDPVIRLLTVLVSGEMSSSQLRESLNIKHRPTFRANYLHPAVNKKLIEMTIQDKPNSRLQKYRLTKKGAEFLNKKG
ncbi:MAG: Fic family protein [Candidatus Omnitrophota bacterium]